MCIWQLYFYKSTDMYKKDLLEYNRLNIDRKINKNPF